jgi:hypothetical protein
MLLGFRRLKWVLLCAPGGCSPLGRDTKWWRSWTVYPAVNHSDFPSVFSLTTISSSRKKGDMTNHDDVAVDDAGEALGVKAPCNEAPVNRTSQLAQASYFAGIMRTELVEARKAVKEARRRWSTRRVGDNTEIPERVVRLKRHVREANRVLKALEKRFPGI